MCVVTCNVLIHNLPSVPRVHQLLGKELWLTERFGWRAGRADVQELAFANCASDLRVTHHV